MGGRYEDTLTPLAARLEKLLGVLETTVEQGLAESPHRIEHEMWIRQETDDGRNAWQDPEEIARCLYRARTAFVELRNAVAEAHHTTNIVRRRVADHSERRAFRVDE